MKDIHRLNRKTTDTSAKFFYEILVPDALGLAVSISIAFVFITLLFRGLG